MRIAITCFFAAMLILGVVVGVLVGLSSSPVVGGLLPLLFALLGGAGGFLILKVDFSQQGSRRGLIVYSGSLSCIAVGIAAGLTLGIWRRETSHSWSLIASSNELTFPPQAAKNESALAWVLLDARLRQLGLTKKQRLVLLGRIESESLRQPDLHSEFVELASLIEAAMPSSDDVKYLIEWQTVLDQVARLKAATAQAREGLPSVLRSEIEQLAASTRMLRDDKDDGSYIDSNAGAADALTRFEDRLLRVQVELFASDLPVDRMNLMLSTFLQNHQGQLDLLPLSRDLASTITSRENS